MSTIDGGLLLISGLVFAYLMFALIHPEKF
jgi:K+-transporting ATPase KdpF subunit